MDIGVHIPRSVTNNENGSPGQKELRGPKQDRSGFNGEDCLQRSLKLARRATTPTRNEGENLSSSFAAAHCRIKSFHQDIPLHFDSRRQEHVFSYSDKAEALDFSKHVGLDDNNINKSSLSPFLHQIPPPSSFRSSGGYGYGGKMMNMSLQGNLTGAKRPFTLSQWAELEQQALIYNYIAANVPIPSILLISLKRSFYPYGSLPPSSFGWGTFHLGFAGRNMNPEPGRCRRTDGKKWRCSKDAVPDQKYCERHINRGRLRSRKHVEVQSSQTVATATKAVTTPQQHVVTGNCNKSNNARKSSNRSLAIGGEYINPSTDSLPNNRVRNPFEFGQISSDSLLNPKSAKTYGSSYLDSGNHNHTHWPEELKSEWTQLSISIPVTSSSPPSSTDQDKAISSPLSLSREFDLSIQNEETTVEPAVKKVNTWIPISWGDSLGGPLGEVLNSTTISPKLESSRTWVVQKPAFCSLSNNSSVRSQPHC